MVPLLDLKREYASIKSEIDAAVATVMAETKYINGPQVKQFEDAAAKYLGVKYAIGVASGTDALLIALRAAGVGPGTEVITTSFSFFATAGTIANLGATPVFVDVEADTFNITAEQIAPRINSKTRAIVPVHLFGQSADLDPIIALGKKHGIAIVEDAAQSLSSKYKNQMSGTIGDLGIYSFYPTKNIGCPGDGGMITTNSDELNEKVRMLKSHGAKTKYFHDLVGYNSRLDTLHAAVLLAKLPHLDGWSAKRRENAAYYNQRFAKANLIRPVEKPFAYHIYNQYSICVDNRDGLRDRLKQEGIGYEIYYPLPLHLQQCFRPLGYKEGDLPVSEKCAKSVISLPIYPMLTEQEREFVADTVLQYVS